MSTEDKAGKISIRSAEIAAGQLSGAANAQAEEREIMRKQQPYHKTYKPLVLWVRLSITIWKNPIRKNFANGTNNNEERSLFNDV